MARPSRTPQDDEDVEEAQAPANSLQFNETISWKPGKPIPTATLINRLTDLHKELSELEQEDVDRASLASAAQDLAHVHLLHHRDEGVKALTACCLADMLRLHAPDAPYTANELTVSQPAFIHVGDPSLRVMLTLRYHRTSSTPLSKFWRAWTAARKASTTRRRPTCWTLYRP
jgi:sister-chromatid-cohesion protein PDS5